MSDNINWIGGSQEYFNGGTKCKETYHGFSHEISEHQKKAFEKLATELISLSESDSLVLKLSAQNMLTAINLCEKVSGPSEVVLAGFLHWLPKVARGMKDVARKLYKYIGYLALVLYDALSKHQYVYGKFVKEFLACRTAECRRRMDYGKVMKETNSLVGSAYQIVNNLLNSKKVTSDINDAAKVMCMVLQYVLLVTQGSNTSIQDIRFKDGQRKVAAPDVKCAEGLDYVLGSLSQSIKTGSIQKLQLCLADISEVLNTIIENVVKLVGNVVGTVGETAKNLLNGLFLG